MPLFVAVIDHDVSTPWEKVDFFREIPSHPIPRDSARIPKKWDIRISQIPARQRSRSVEYVPRLARGVWTGLRVMAKKIPIKLSMQHGTRVILLAVLFWRCTE